MKRTIKHISLLTALVALLALLTVAAYAEEPAAPAPSIDMSYVFTPQIQLTVYVDGEWAPALSNTYGFGDTATITAPEKSGDKSFSHWTADGSIISYSRELNLTMNAHTTLYAVYAGAAPTEKPVAGFTSITRTDDGESISFQAIASGDEAGIVYSTKATGNNLKIGGTDVTPVAAVKYSDLLTLNDEYMPASILDANKCWMLQITPDDADAVYHARAYVTVDGTTTYGDVKDVKLSELQSGIWMVANPGSDMDDAVTGLTFKTVTFEPNGGIGATMTQVFLNGKPVTLRANTFTREGYTFTGWATEKNGSVVYKDGDTVTLSENTTLYAQWENPRAEDERAVAEVTEKINALPESNKVTKSDKNAIEEARKAYDALTDDQKAMISSDTLKKLTDAEKALAPQTGDNSHMGLWISLLALSLCCIAAIVLYSRKKKASDR